MRIQKAVNELESKQESLTHNKSKEVIECNFTLNMRLLDRCLPGHHLCFSYGW